MVASIITPIKTGASGRLENARLVREERRVSRDLQNFAVLEAKSVFPGERSPYPVTLTTLRAIPPAKYSWRRSNPYQSLNHNEGTNVSAQLMILGPVHHKQNIPD